MFVGCIQVSLRFGMLCARLQVRQRAAFLHEHPGSATSWGHRRVHDLCEQTGAQIVSFDQCRFGLVFPGEKYLMKNTKILTNSSFVVNEFKDHHCLRDHRHGRIEGTKLGRQVSKYAAHYPRELVNTIARAVIAHVDAEDQSPA